MIPRHAQQVAVERGVGGARIRKQIFGRGFGPEGLVEFQVQKLGVHAAKHFEGERGRDVVEGPEEALRPPMVREPDGEARKGRELAMLVEAGEVLELEYVMADPVNWVGEWRNTKQWLRVDHTDIGEVECLPDLNDNLPSTQAGQAGLER